MTNVQNLLRKKIQKNNFFFFYNYMRNFNKIPPHILVYANPFYLPIFQNQLNPLSSGGGHYKWQIPKQWLCIHIHKVDLSDILFLNWGKQWQQLIKTLPFCRSLNNFFVEFVNQDFPSVSFFHCRKPSSRESSDSIINHHHFQ